jgi:peptide/nickel transport system substrate-binding protein
VPDRRDGAVLAGLALTLAVLTLVVVAGWTPATVPATATDPTPSVDAGPTYVEGMLGRPTAVSPFGARTAADRALVSLVFSGLVRLGPGETLVGDLASDWDVDESGSVYTFHLRPDAIWHDGEPVTAHDVVFTITSLQDPAYDGPGGASWRDVTATALDDRTVRLELKNPIAGFLTAATQPIAPAHLLEGSPADLLSTNPFGQQPVGSGPYRLVSWNAGSAELEAATPWGASPDVAPGQGSGQEDSLASPTPTPRPGRPLPYLERITFRFYSDPAELVADLRSGTLDAASDLPPSDAVAAGDIPGFHLLRYPGSTLTALLLDLRPARKEFADARARRGLLQAIDRDGIVTATTAGTAVRADALIPPSSAVFDAAKSPVVATDAKAARRSLEAAGWTRRSSGGWTAPGSKGRYTLELLAPDAATNPVANATAVRIAADLHSIGLDVDLVGLDAVSLTQRLASGDFAAAVVDVAIGLDPDLYPLLASSQTLAGGSNVMGLQDATLDGKLEAARRPAPTEARTAAYADLQAYLADKQYVLPIAWRDDLAVVSDALRGPTIRRLGSGSDRFYDVLAWSLVSDR